ncbi:MAG: GTP cyclohydrolase II [Alphaproteobacteria bacterium]|nr:GTP cyclohydrolase II [Alphaproteobacteria bacterium]
MALPRIASLSGVVLPKLELSAEADLPTRYGALRVVGFRGADGQELGAVVQGAVDGHVGVPVRLHSECFTGDLMGSLRCDCRDQLEASLRFIARCARGAVLYLPQEGRGIGLVNKIRAYALQDRGLDTVDANLALGFPNDLRTYEIAAAMIRALGIQSVCLLTNNPAKVHGLQRHGIEVAGIIPLRTPPNEHNVGYLNTKRQRSGHLL